MKKKDDGILIEIVIGVIIGVIACTYLWFLDPKSREELMNIIWMLG